MGWYINASSSPDGWYSDEFDTMEEAINEGVDEYRLHLQGVSTELFDNDSYYPDEATGVFEVGERLDFSPVLYPEDVIEYVTEQASWQCGDVADSWLYSLTDEELQDLQNNMEHTFDDWLKKYNLEPTFFNIINIKKIDANDYLQ